MQNAEKLLFKGRLSSAYKTVTDKEQRKAIVSEYSSLLKEHSNASKMLMRHLQNAILPAVAIYRVLPQNGASKTEAKRMIRAAIRESAIPMCKTFRKMGRLPGFYSLFKRMCKMSSKTAYGSSGWDMQWIESGRDEITWNCHSCFYHNTLSKYGIPELTPYFCESDDVMYGNIPGIKWCRTKTLGRGGAMCDFHFKRDKSANK